MGFHAAHTGVDQRTRISIREGAFSNRSLQRSTAGELWRVMGNWVDESFARALARRESVG
jgi:muconolactone delta-isomerase